MKVTYRLHEVTTGRPLSVPVWAQGRWEQSISKRGSGRHALVIPSVTPFTPAQWHESTMPWWNVLVEYWDGVPAFAGIIIDKHWSPRRQTLTVDTWTVDALMEDRYPFGIGSYLTTTFEIVNASLRGAISAVVARVSGDISVAPPQSWALPFDLPYLGEGGGFSAPYPNKDWKTAQEIIEEIQKRPDGPDLAFIPKVDANGWLRWDVLPGDPLIPGPEIDLPLSVRGSSASDVTMHEYGKDMNTGVFVRGEGYDDRRPVGEAGFLAGPAMAVRDVAQDAVAEDGDMAGVAAASLARNRSPVDQFDIGSLRLGDGAGAVHPSKARLGARLNARYSGDGYRAPFTASLYWRSMSFDSSRPDFVSPEVQVL